MTVSPRTVHIDRLRITGRQMVWTINNSTVTKLWKTMNYGIKAVLTVKPPITTSRARSREKSAISWRYIRKSETHIYYLSQTLWDF